MAMSLKTGRVLLIASSLLLVSVAAVVAFVVIPSVKADTAPQAIPERAVSAFWIVCALLMLAAAFFLEVTLTTRGRTAATMILQAVAALLVLLIGYGLTDAAMATSGHGPLMHGTALVLFASAAATYAAGLVGAAVAFLLPKKA